MLDWMWDRGWDNRHGGMLYFVDVHGGSVQEYWHDMKFWWPHNETIIATLLAWIALTGDDKYGQLRHQEVHDWASPTLSPIRSTASGTAICTATERSVRRSRATFGRGRFHLPRMQLNAWRWLEDGP